MFKNIIGTHKPDILDCISNLSSDEVFTPPSVVNQVLDLLPAEVWTNSKLKFLDPACKSGVFLREIAKRLMVGLEVSMPDEEERRIHIFKNMLYGISITELTGYLARRSLYYSKVANSDFSIIKFDNEQGNVHYSRGKHNYIRGKCVDCGAPEGALDRGDQLENHAYQFIHGNEVFKMKFDVIIGNPPYQLDDDGFGASASPIYQLFVDQAKKLNPKYISMIIPARWYAGGKGLDDFRNRMINDRSISHLVDFPKLFECFPGVEIKGGVCYFLMNNTHNGDCIVKTVMDGQVVSEMKRDLREGGDVLIRTNEAMPILKKIRDRNEVTLDRKVSSQKPFGLRTFEMGTDNKDKKNDLILYRRGGTSFTPKESVTVNTNWIEKYKTLTPMAGDGHGRVPAIVTGEPIVAPKNSVCTETYLVVDVFDDQIQAENLALYLKTKFVRFLISLRKNTQHVTNTRFSFVPDLDMKKKWTDKDLYKRYELTQEEIDFIESYIKEMI